MLEASGSLRYCGPHVRADPKGVTVRFRILINMLLHTGILAGLMAPVAAADWPHWRGPARNDVTDESSGWTGSQWPLEPTWSAGVGEGASSPLVIGDRVYVMGWNNDREHLRCLDARSGEEIWHVADRAPRYGRQSTGDQALYSGISSTPEYDGQTGYLYSLGIDGDLRCRDTNRRGAEIWSLNLYDRYGIGQRPRLGRAGRRDYGYTSSPLVQGAALLVEVGDPRGGTLKAYDKRSGAELWSSACCDEAGHTGGPVPMTVDGTPCVALLTMRNLVVIRLDAGHEGETLAERPWVTDYANNIPTPAVEGNRVIVTTSYNQASMCCLEATSGGFRELWNVDNPSGVCSPVIHDGHVYWAWRGIHCVDLDDGAERWLGQKVGTPGSCLITADDRLIVLGDRGDLYLVETTQRSPNEYTELARERIRLSSDVWPHVVLASGRLYCKDRRGDLRCFEAGRR